MKREQPVKKLLRVLHAAALLLAVVDFLAEGLGLDLYLSLGIALALLFLARLWRPQRAVPLSIPGLGLCLYTALRLYARGEPALLPGLWAVLLLLCYLLSMHGQGLENGLHNMPGEKPMEWPRGVRGKNALLVLAFLFLCLLLASLPHLERGADSLWRLTTAGLQSTYGAVTQGIRERAMGTPTPGPTGKPSPSPEPEEEPEPEPTEEREELTPVSPLLRILLFLFMLTALPLALISLVLFLLLNRKQGPGPYLRGLLLRLKKRFGSGEGEEAYIEEKEKLRDWRSLFRPRKGRGVPGGYRRRAGTRFRDLPDDRARVRYAWRMLRSSPEGQKHSPSLTPRELGAALGEERYAALAAQYELARYAPGRPLAPDAGDLAAAALRSLRRR